MLKGQEVRHFEAREANGRAGRALIPGVLGVSGVVAYLPLPFGSRRCLRHGELGDGQQQKQQHLTSHSSRQSVPVPG